MSDENFEELKKVEDNKNRTKSYPDFSLNVLMKLHRNANKLKNG